MPCSWTSRAPKTESTIAMTDEPEAQPQVRPSRAGCPEVATAERAGWHGRLPPVSVLASVLVLVLVLSAGASVAPVTSGQLYLRRPAAATRRGRRALPESGAFASSVGSAGASTYVGAGSSTAGTFGAGSG